MSLSLAAKVLALLCTAQPGDPFLDKEAETAQAPSLRWVVVPPADERAKKIVQDARQEALLYESEDTATLQEVLRAYGGSCKDEKCQKDLAKRTHARNVLTVTFTAGSSLNRLVWKDAKLQMAVRDAEGVLLRGGDVFVRKNSETAARVAVREWLVEIERQKIEEEKQRLDSSLNNTFKAARSNVDALATALQRAAGLGGLAGQTTEVAKRLAAYEKSLDDSIGALAEESKWKASHAQIPINEPITTAFMEAGRAAKAGFAITKEQRLSAIEAELVRIWEVTTKLHHDCPWLPIHEPSAFQALRDATKLQHETETELSRIADLAAQAEGAGKSCSEKVAEARSRTPQRSSTEKDAAAAEQAAISFEDGAPTAAPAAAPRTPQRSRRRTSSAPSVPAPPIPPSPQQARARALRERAVAEQLNAADHACALARRAVDGATLATEVGQMLRSAVTGLVSRISLEIQAQQDCIDGKKRVAFNTVLAGGGAVVLGLAAKAAECRSWADLNSLYGAGSEWECTPSPRKVTQFASLEDAERLRSDVRWATGFQVGGTTLLAVGGAAVLAAGGYWLYLGSAESSPEPRVKAAFMVTPSSGMLLISFP